MLSYCKTQTLNKFYSIDFSGVTGTPITLQEAKDHLFITSSDDDTYLTTLIKQCVEAAERYCSISIYTKTVTVLGDFVDEFELPYGPLVSFTGASYRGGNTSYTVLASDQYTLDTGFPFARFNNYQQGRAQLIYTAGDYLPDSLKLGILNEISFRYENRGDSVNRYAVQNVGISEGAQALLNPFRRLQWL